MLAYPPILSIVIGLCWTDFVAMFSAQAGASRGRLIRMTIASSLLLTSLALVFSEADSALSVAGVGFALYFSGATP